MMRKAANIYWLGVKELRSFLGDFVLLGLVAYAFSLAVALQARSNSQELNNASIAIVDEDHSELSRRIAHAFFPPLFQLPRLIAEQDIIPAMNAGRFTFVIDIPPNFERYVLAGRQPGLQVNVDATAMIQAGLGSAYAQQIITTEIADFLSHAEGVKPSAVNLNVRIAFNPNLTTAWFTSVMAIINNITMLAIILAGAAVVREREHGTMDHLLVMPLTPFEIALSKVWANGLVIAVAVGLCVYLVVRTDTWNPRRRLDTAIYGRRGDLPVFRNRDRNLSGHGRALHAAAWPALHAGVFADEHALGQQYAA